jgi:hypothetical protein
MGDPKVINFYREAAQRIKRLPGVDEVAIGMLVPWRDRFGPPIQFGVDGYTPADGEENPRARFRVVSPRYFDVLGVPLVAGRDFTEEDRRGNELVVIVSQSVAQRLFPNADALNHHMWWIDDYFGKVAVPRRRRRRRGRREHREGTGDGGVSAGSADRRGRPAARACRG